MVAYEKYKIYMGNNSRPLCFDANHSSTFASEDVSQPIPNFVDALPSPDASAADVRAWLRTWITEHSLSLQSLDIKNCIACVTWMGQDARCIVVEDASEQIRQWGGYFLATWIAADIVEAQKIARDRARRETVAARIFKAEKFCEDHRVAIRVILAVVFLLEFWYFH